MLTVISVCLFVIIELAIWATGVDGEQLSLRIFNTMESTLVADETDPKFCMSTKQDSHKTTANT
jgi:hypothetical protein